MTEVLTATQMRAKEQAAIDAGTATGLDLMERAGVGVVEAVFEEWPDLAHGPHRAVVLCGPGNNGGDGFVVARLLAGARWGVEVFFYGDADALPPDAKTNHARWSEVGSIRPLTFPDVSRSDAAAFAKAAYDGSGTALVVDALFGIGLNRPIDGLAAIAERVVEAQKGGAVHARHVSVDVPSGLGEEGPVFGRMSAMFSADLTVTFHARKTAHGTAPQCCGKLVVKDIGL